MKKKQNIIIGLLTLVIMASVVIVTFPDAGLRLDIDKTKSSFYVYEKDNWELAGREQTQLVRDSKILSPVKNGITIEQFYNNGSNYVPFTSDIKELPSTQFKIVRTSIYPENIKVIDTYTFDGGVDDIELFPVAHIVDIYGAENLTFQYKVTNLGYNGPDKKDVGSPQYFKRQMKVEWQPGYYYTNLQNTLRQDGVLTVRYKIPNNYASYQVRLFDPCSSGSVYGTLLYNQTFGTDAECWQGNQTSGTDSGDAYIAITSGGNHMNSSDFDLATIANAGGWSGGIYTLNMTVASNNISYSKLRFMSSCTENSGPRLMWEQQGGGLYRIKHEGDGYASVDNLADGQKVVLEIQVNATSNRSTTRVINASNSALLGTISNQAFSDANLRGDCVRVEGGTFGSSSPSFKVYDLKLINGTTISDGSSSSTCGDGANNFTFECTREGWSEDGWLDTTGYLYANSAQDNSWSPETSMDTWTKQSHTINLRTADVSYLNLYFGVAGGEFTDNIRFYFEDQGDYSLFKHQGTFQIALNSSSGQEQIPHGANVTVYVDVNRVRNKVNATLNWSNGTHTGSATITEQSIGSAISGDRVAINIGNTFTSGEPRLYSWLIQENTNLAGIANIGFEDPVIGWTGGTGNVTQNEYFTYSVNVTCTGSAANDVCGTVSAYLDPKQLNAGSLSTITGYTSYENYQMYNVLLNEAVNRTKYKSMRFDTTSGEFVCPSGNCMWTPWLDTSNACSNPVSDFHTHGDNLPWNDSSTFTETTNVLVTDEFSEYGLALSQGNASFEDEFEAWYDMRQSLVGECQRLAGASAERTGNLTAWVYGRNGYTLTAMDRTERTAGSGEYCHSASDTNWRDALALYQAGSNTHFSASNRAKYNALASAIMNDSIREEFIYDCRPTANWGQVCYWATAGNAVVHEGLNNNDGQADMYVGYYQDALMALLAHYEATGNATVLTVYNDTIKSFFVATGYDGGTTGADFYTSYFRFEWEISGSNVVLGNAQSAWDITNAGITSWDEADAPRVMEICRVPYLYNISTGGTIDGATSSLQDYCQAWDNAADFGAYSVPKSYDDDRQTLRYGDSGVMFIGMALPSFNNPVFVNEHYNTLLAKLFEGGSNWDTTNHRMEGVSCGHGLTYSGVRATKTLMYGMDLDAGIYGSAVDYGEDAVSDTTPPTISNIQATSITDTTATITWTTSELANSSVQYGIVSNTYTSTSSASGSTVSHTRPLSGLGGTTTYYYKVTSCDASGNCATSAQNSFTTLQEGLKAGDVSTTIGAEPFYTTDSQPSIESCLVGMSHGEKCEVSWQVNATGIPGVAHTFYVRAFSSENATEVQSSTDSVTIVGTPPLPSITHCPGIYAVHFLPDVRNYNYVTKTITENNIKALNQSTCLFNATRQDSTQVDYYAYINTTLTSKQTVFCGATQGTAVALSTTPTIVVADAINTTISCWMNITSISQAEYKAVNVTVTYQ